MRGRKESRQVSVALIGWATHVLQWKLQLCNKSFLSPDCKLQLVYMKLESLVIVNQHVTVNT